MLSGRLAHASKATTLKMYSHATVRGQEMATGNQLPSRNHPPCREKPPRLASGFGAGNGNRTRIPSLEGWSSTIELSPPRLTKEEGRRKREDGTAPCLVRRL